MLLTLKFLFDAPKCKVEISLLFYNSDNFYEMRLLFLLLLMLLYFFSCSKDFIWTFNLKNYLFLSLSYLPSTAPILTTFPKSFSSPPTVSFHHSLKYYTHADIYLWQNHDITSIHLFIYILKYLFTI